MLYETTGIQDIVSKCPYCGRKIVFKQQDDDARQKFDRPIPKKARETFEKMGYHTVEFNPQEVYVRVPTTRCENCLKYVTTLMVAQAETSSSNEYRIEYVLNRMHLNKVIDMSVEPYEICYGRRIQEVESIKDFTPRLISELASYYENLREKYPLSWEVVFFNEYYNVLNAEPVDRLEKINEFHTKIDEIFNLMYIQTTEEEFSLNIQVVYKKLWHMIEYSESHFASYVHKTDKAKLILDDVFRMKLTTYFPKLVYNSLIITMHNCRDMFFASFLASPQSKRNFSLESRINSRYPHFIKMLQDTL